MKPFLIGLLASLVLLAPGGAAMAHDELLSSDPEDGATLQDAPEELLLTFSGQIAQVGAQLQITDEAGTDVADGDPVVQGTDLVQPLSDIGSGDYEVIWRVTSSDGHPISGAFGFTVEVAEEPAEESVTAEDTTEPATEETTEPVTEEATEDATTDEATAEATEDVTETTTPATDTVATDDDGGLPVWVWVVVGLAVLALVALLARTWSRGRR